MKVPSLEELAERWTLAHTIAVAAWAVVLVLGLFLLFRNTADTYPATSDLKIYAGENATFTYPANWTLNNCELGKPFIELPGTIRSDYKGRRNYQLEIYGTGAYNCLKDRPERFDIYPEDLKASDTPCAPGTSTDGERLGNGLYFQLQEQDDRVVAVHVKQNSCFAPPETLVLGFAFADPKDESGDEAEFGLPGVAKEVFLASQQYQDIRELARSIKY